MLVFEFCMLVVMCVRLNAIPFKVMDMLVVLVMFMFMFVFMLQRFMQMFMCMVLGQMKPNTKAHQRRSNPKRQRCGFREDHQGRSRSYKWCRRKVGAGAGCSQTPQGQYKQNKTDAVAQKTDRHRGQQSGKSGQHGTHTYRNQRIDCACHDALGSSNEQGIRC